MTPPARVDPFSEISAGASAAPPAPAAPGLSLAIVLTQNTKNAAGYLRKGSLISMGSFDSQKPFDQLIAQIRGDFKSVVKADSVEQAKALGTDLVGVLDFSVAFPWSVSGDVEVNEAVLFLDASGRTLDNISAGEKKGVRETSHYSLDGPTRFQESFTTIQNGVWKQFHAKLAASEPIQAYNRSRSAAAVPAPAAAAPAVAPVKHSDVDAPAYKSAEDAGKFALVVGVENYESLPAAEYAERDAAAVREHLLALGYPERNVIFLTGPKAGKSGIEKYVESWLPRNVDENSRVFVYFSGHGAPDPKTGQAYLMPWDGDAMFLSNTAYPIKRLYEKLGELKARRVVVALDACFSGAGGRSVLAKGARPLVTQVDAGIPSSDKLVVLAAASGDEITGTAETQGHGLFTYYLLKGLNDRGGAASIRALYDYLKPKVQDAARRDNRDQTPQLLPATAPSGEKF